MSTWAVGASFTKHARALLCIATTRRAGAGPCRHDAVTERSARGIVTVLVDAGYMAKDNDGRRNRYRIEEHLPLRDPITQELTIGEMLDLLVGVNPPRNTHHQDRTHYG